MHSSNRHEGRCRICKVLPTLITVVRLGAISVLLSVHWAAFAQYLAPAPSAHDVPGKLELASPDELSALMAAKQSPVHISAGDVLETIVYGVKDFDVKTKVEADGTTRLPLIGAVDVRGYTINAAEQEVAARLRANGMVLDPQVTIVMLEAPTQIITVSGEVNRPGSFPADGRHTLFEYISLAGGLKDTASQTVTLNRPGSGKAISIQLGPNPSESPYADIPVFAGDTILVSKVGIIYVVGAFFHQGAYPLKNTTPTTVMQAIALGGGIGFQAEKVAWIVRSASDQREQIRLNLNAIMRRQAPDPVLQADDILLVPTNAMKAAIKGGGTGTLVGLADALIYTF
jgi:polysaccharide biosynthesis/export protein